MQSLKLIVEGRVQGVGFRHFIHTNAKRLNLKGYVKNLDDGKVEILIIGAEDKISDLIKIAKKGPSFSWVYNVKIHSVDEDIKEMYNDFKIEY